MRRALPRLPFIFSLLGLSACAPEGPSAFVTFNLAPDGECRYESGTDVEFWPIGQFDILSGGDGNGDNCKSPYVMHLQVNSFLRSNSDEELGRAEPNILQLHSAQVRLMTVARSTILFDRVDPPLPNPFLVVTNNSLFPAQGDTPSDGVAVVEAIPADYAGQLDGFDGKQIMAEVQLFGTTTGDTDIDFKPFVYAIEICSGCLTRCLGADILDRGLDIDDIAPDDECQDNSGQDGRVCIDPDC